MTYIIMFLYTYFYALISDIFILSLKKDNGGLFGFKHNKGKITTIRNESPAHQSQLKVGDQIVIINNKTIWDRNKIAYLLESLRDSVTLGVTRNTTKNSRREKIGPVYTPGTALRPNN